MPQVESAKGRPNQTSVENLPLAMRTRISPPSGLNPILRNDASLFVTNKTFWPKKLVQMAREITSLLSNRPSNTKLKFLLDQESGQKNFCILQKYNFDLTTALEAQANSPLPYGSEFKSTKVLSPIFALHPNWERVKHIL